MHDRYCVRTGFWALGVRLYPHSGQDTNAGIEGYHSSLKLRLGLIRATLVDRRPDWLTHVLTTDTIHHYVRTEYYKAMGHIRNYRQEELTRNAILRVCHSLYPPVHIAAMQMLTRSQWPIMPSSNDHSSVLRNLGYCWQSSHKHWCSSPWT